MLLSLLLSVCIFGSGVVKNCDPRINNFTICSTQVPSNHLNIVQEWSIRDNSRNGRATWGDDRKQRKILLGENSSCAVFRHEIGHLVQLEYGFPGFEDKKTREQFAWSYSRSMVP